MDTLSLDKQAMAKLTDGIVLLDNQGRPVSASLSSQPWLRQCIEISPVLADMIAATKAARLALPAAVDLRAEGDDDREMPAEAWLVANAGAGHALLIRSRPQVQSRAPAGGDGFLTLLGLGVRQEVSRLGAMLRDRGALAAETAPILRQADYLESLLEEIGQLAELHERDEIFCEERLLLPELLREIVLELKPQWTARGIGASLECADTPPLAPVYGNARWLKQVLSTLLASLEEGSPQLGHIQAHLRQLGDFAVLGASARNARGAPLAPAPEPVAKPAPRRALRMRICRRIVKLHGGTLNLRLLPAEDAQEDSEGALESFTLTLPTGLPAQDRSRLSCAECRISVQAMQYARDLAKVMARLPHLAATNEKGTP